jgi:hypothetical protein
MSVPGKWSPSVWVGAIMVGVFVVLGVFGPLIAPYAVGTRAMDLDHMYAPMSARTGSAPTRAASTPCRSSSTARARR